MSHISLNLQGSSVTQRVSNVSTLREYNDESLFFSGVFRRSNLNLTIENTSRFLNQARNNQVVELFYNPNNKNLNNFFIFQGIIDEGSTQNNITQKEVQLTIVDSLKQIEDVSIEDGDQAMIDSMYGSQDIALDRQYIINFLEFIKTKGVLNITFDVALTIESIFPPTDSYYNADNVPALNILQEMVKATNSFMVTERNKLLIKPRPVTGFTEIPNNEVISITSQTDGYNKLYNSIIINDSDPYIDQPSIDLYGVRNLDITTYAAPTSELAQTYLSYYKNPKKELNITIIMNNRNLALKVGDGITLNIPNFEDLSVQAVTGNYFIISRELEFEAETINLRLRES